MTQYKLTVARPMVIGTSASGANGVPGVGVLGGGQVMVP